MKTAACKTWFFLCVFSSLAFAQQPVPKQLAGPATDFMPNGLMNLPDPAKVSNQSHWSMLPFSLEQTVAGDWTWQGSMSIDQGRHVRLMLFSPFIKNAELHLISPTTKIVTTADLTQTKPRQALFGFPHNNFPGTYYAFEELEAGNWLVHIAVQQPNFSRSANSRQTNIDGYLLVSSESPYQLQTHFTHFESILGKEMGIVAKATQGVQIQHASASIHYPSGSKQNFELHSLDGQQYQGSFLLAEPGDCLVHVVATGVTPQGLPLQRSSIHLLPVLLPSIAWVAPTAWSQMLDANRLALHVPASQNPGTLSQRYQAYAEVWANGSNGNMLPVCWVGGIVALENNEFILGLDTRWLALTGASLPLELRNFRLQDIDSHIPVALKNRIDVAVDGLPAGANNPLENITPEMIMGPVAKNSTQSPWRNNKLLLLHGYCSSDVWSSQQGLFDDSAVFFDLDQNRSHDKFARLILNFGKDYSSYGIVAHSQGGAAALHLYTYYWSGLDFAIGERLIQSVGTPYQGTNLAGNLAALGEVFGVGCGVNNDLTYSGAALWLAGIPTWARNTVNFYTTSFLDRPFLYDYCNLFTDLLLTDPDDGVTEQMYGTLPQGINRGHKEGWCHTEDMRDPGQTTDTARNQEMNLKAAR